MTGMGKKGRGAGRAETTSRVPLLLPLIAVGAASVLFYAFTADDAYIALRYAENLLAGEGLVFNPGERVEGFSSPLHILLVAAPALLGAPLVAVAKVLGIVAAAGASLLAVGLARRLGAGDWLAGAAGLAVALHPGMLYFASSGMETTLYAAWVTAAALRLSTELDAEARSRWPVSLWLLGLASVTRPEGAVLLAAACVVRLWRARSSRRLLLREALGWVPAWAPLVAWVAFRRAYYGEWLPNVYYAKPGGLGWEGLTAGLAYLHTAIMGGGTYLVLGLALVALQVRRPRAAVAGVLLLAAGQAAFVVYSGGDWMIEARYGLPALPVVLALAAAGAAGLGRRYGVGPLLRLAALGLLVAFGVGSVRLAGELRRDRVHDHAHRSDGNEALGRWLAESTPPEATVVTDEIGAIAYYSDRHVIDTLGLVDHEIARILHRHDMSPYSHATSLHARRAASAAVVRAVLRRSPDVVLLDYEGTVGTSGRYNPRHVNLAAQPLYRRLGTEYRYVRPFVLSEAAVPPKTFLVFERRSRAVH